MRKARHAQLLKQAAARHFAASRWDDFIVVGEILAESEPTARAFSRLAYADMQLKDLDKAETRATLALLLEEHCWQARTLRAQCYEAREDWAAAQADYNILHTTGREVSKALQRCSMLAKGQKQKVAQGSAGKDDAAAGSLTAVEQQRYKLPGLSQDMADKLPQLGNCQQPDSSQQGNIRAQYNAADLPSDIAAYGGIACSRAETPNDEDDDAVSIGMRSPHAEDDPTCPNTAAEAVQLTDAVRSDAADSLAAQADASNSAAVPADALQFPRCLDMPTSEAGRLTNEEVDVLAALQAEMDKLNARLHQVQADEQAKAMAKSRIQDLALAELALWAQNAQIKRRNIAAALQHNAALSSGQGRARAFAEEAGSLADNIPQAQVAEAEDEKASSASEALAEVATAAEQSSPNVQGLPVEATAAVVAAPEQVAEVGETSSTPEAPSAAPTAAEQASPQVKHVAVEATVVAAQEQVAEVGDKASSSATEAPCEAPTAVEQSSPQVNAPSQNGQAEGDQTKGAKAKSASKRARRKAKKAAEAAKPEVKTVKAATAKAPAVAQPTAAEPSPASDVDPAAKVLVAQVAELMDKEASTLSEVPSEVATAAEQSSPQVAEAMDREDSTAPEACSGVPTAAEQGSLREEPLPTDLAAAAAAAEEQVVAPSQEGQADDSPAEGTLRKSASKRARRKAKKAAELAREIKTVMPTATASGVTHPEAADASPARTASPEAQTPVAQVDELEPDLIVVPAGVSDTEVAEPSPPRSVSEEEDKALTTAGATRQTGQQQQQHQLTRQQPSTAAQYVHGADQNVSGQPNNGRSRRGRGRRGQGPKSKGPVAPVTAAPDLPPGALRAGVNGPPRRSQAPASAQAGALRQPTAAGQSYPTPKLGASHLPARPVRPDNNRRSWPTAQPAARGPRNVYSGSTPAKPDHTPAKPAPTPAKPAPTPAKPDPAPAKPGPTPAKPGPTPAKPAPAPAKPGPTPAKPTGPSAWGQAAAGGLSAAIRAPPQGIGTQAPLRAPAHLNHIQALEWYHARNEARKAAQGSPYGEASVSYVPYLVSDLMQVAGPVPPEHAYLRSLAWEAGCSTFVGPDGDGNCLIRALAVGIVVMAAGLRPEDRLAFQGRLRHLQGAMRANQALLPHQTLPGCGAQTKLGLQYFQSLIEEEVRQGQPGQPSEALLEEFRKPRASNSLVLWLRAVAAYHIVTETDANELQLMLGEYGRDANTPNNLFEANPAAVCRDWVLPFPSGSPQRKRNGYAGQAVAKALATQLSLDISLGRNSWEAISTTNRACWSDHTQLLMLFMRKGSHYGIGWL